MIPRGLLVFVTTELHPFTQGGIGRCLFNILRSLSNDDLLRTVVVLTRGEVKVEDFAFVFPGVRLHQLRNCRNTYLETELSHFQSEDWLDTSIQVLATLRTIAASGAIEYVEFPDWSALGFATIQEKFFSGFLRDSTIAVRVHSTEAILVLEETRLLNPKDLRKFDLERKCYRDCDLIVAHLEPVAERTRRSFGFTTEEWWPRVHIAMPPFGSFDFPVKDNSILPDRYSSIVFSSKIQELKRPQVFVQAAVEFLAENADFVGDVILVCTGLRSELARKILRLIPDKFVSRFKYFEEADPEFRNQVIASGVTLFPTSFESLCLAAYEASWSGAIVVLNDRNPAFGENTPWIDRVNCIKFDGSVHGLSRALSECFRLREALSVVDAKIGTQPWELRRSGAAVAWSELEAEPKVSVIVVCQYDGSLLYETLESIASQSFKNVEIVIVDDGSSDIASQLVLNEIEARRVPNTTVLRTPVAMGRAAARNLGVDCATGEYVLHLGSGDLLRGDVLHALVRSLENCMQFDIVVTQAGRYTDADKLTVHDIGIETFVGEAIISGVALNNFSRTGWLCRMELARTIVFRPEVGILDAWAWMLHAINAGKRVLVAPFVGVVVRARIEQDLGTPVDDFRRLHHIMIAGAPFELAKFPLATLSLTCVSLRDETTVYDWYRHMKQNSYEDEVEFVAQILGHTWIGLHIRKNRVVSIFLEKALRFITGLR